jgi:hypothetical protein
MQMAPRRGKIAKRAVATHKTAVEKDDSSVESTATTTNESDGRHREKENVLEMHGTEDKTSPAGIEILLPTVDGQEKSLSMLTETNVDDNGTLSIIQKTMIANWAEENFLRANKIMTYEEATNHEKLPDALCRAMKIKKEAWLIVGSEAIRKLRSVMSDKLSLHRKAVKHVYTGK